MQTTIRLAVIYGSTRPGRMCDRVVKWLVSQLGHYPLIELDIIDPLDFGLVPSSGDETGEIAARLQRADAFIIVTPEYNHSFPASLKFFIDAFYEPWHVKPIAFVAYGGISGGLRAVEHLRLVFAELHAVAIRDTVSIVSPWDRLDKDGHFDRPEEALRHLSRMMGRLQWWARALRVARNEQPYQAAA